MAELSEVERLLIEEYALDLAGKRLDEVVRAMGCGSPVSGELHRRFWLAVGVHRSWTQSGDPVPALEASKRRGAVWSPIYGAAERVEDDTTTEFELWSDATPSEDLFSLTLVSFRPEQQLWIDGLETEVHHLPSENRGIAVITAGSHLLQMGFGGQVMAASAVHLAGASTAERSPDGSISVRLVPPVAPAPPPEPAPEPAIARPAPQPRVPLPIVVTGARPNPPPSPPSRGVVASVRPKASRGLLAAGVVVTAFGGLSLYAANQMKADQSRVLGGPGYVRSNWVAGIGGYSCVGIGTGLAGLSFAVNRW